MNKYFFDLIGEHRTQYDHRGHVLPSPETAFQMAELIALDLGVEAGGTWHGWAVQVCNALGQKFFSVAVCDLDLAAA